MKIKKYLNYRNLLLLLGTTVLAGNALASPAPANLLVTANVAESCTLGTDNNLTFGSYTLADLSANTDILITCTNGTAYTIGLNSGVGSSDYNLRKMTGGAGGNDTLEYNLYQTSEHTTVWGPDTNGVTGTGNGTTQHLPVYGFVRANQSATTGNYSDTVTITVTYNSK